MTTKEQAYTFFIDDLQLRHFRGSEFVAYSQRTNSGGRAGIPPKSKWQNIVPTMQVLDQLRAHFGKSVTLTSTYRATEYNRACGGAKHSQHKEFTACDIQVADTSPSKVYKLLMRWRDAGVFKGGLGKYPTFVHIDTRGSNADW